MGLLGMDTLLGPAVDSSPALRPRLTILDGQAVRIVPLDPARHGDALYEGTHGEEKERLWCYLWESPFPDRTSFDVHLKQKSKAEDRLLFAILEKPSDIAVGYVAYMGIQPRHRVIEVGSILYTPRLQRSIGATEAMYLMARHAFDDLGYRRYEWKTSARNTPSRNAALRLGFTFEGIFRQHMIIKGHNRDTAWFSMLDSEWPSRKEALESWLEPSNFDSNGRQKRSLSEFQDWRRQ